MVRAGSMASTTSSYTCAELWCRPELRDSEFVASTHAQARSCRQARVWCGACWRAASRTGSSTSPPNPDMERGPAALRCGLTGAFAFPIATGNRTLGAMEFFARRIWQPDLALTDTARVGGPADRRSSWCASRPRSAIASWWSCRPTPSWSTAKSASCLPTARPSRLLGATQPADLLGRSVYEFVHPDHREFARAAGRRASSSTSVALGAMEMKYVRLDGIVRATWRCRPAISCSRASRRCRPSPATSASARSPSRRSSALSKLVCGAQPDQQAITRLTDPQSAVRPGVPDRGRVRRASSWPPS